MKKVLCRGRRHRRPAKRIMSIILSVMMLFSVTTGMTMTAQATSITQAQAVNWANSQIGKSLDYDGNGVWCVDLTKYYYAYLGVTPVQGNGCDYATNSLPSGWQRIPYSSGFAAQPGDIAVWTYLTRSEGHVAIVTGANTSSMNVVEQNQSTGTRSHSYNYTSGTFYGVIRPNFSGSSGSQTPSGEGIIRWGSDVNDTVTITGNRKFWFKRIDNDSNYYIDVYLDSQKVLNHIQTDSTNLISYNVDVSTIRNGSHILRAELYNSVGKYEDSIHFISSNYVDFWSISKSDNSSLNIDLSGVPNLSNQVKFWFKRTNSDSNHYFNIYIDGNKVADHISAGSDSLISYLLETKTLTNGFHSIKCEYAFTDGSSTTLKLFNVNNSPNPIGNIDLVEGKCGQIYVSGWAFDPNDISKALSVNVYIGAGSTADGGEGHAITANTVRSDVNSVYNCGNNHGISHTISTNKSGTQTIYVYAINIGSGNTVLLGSKTVTIRAGHSWNSGTVTTEATCTKAGTKTYTCSACGATKTETISPIGHVWDEGAVTTPATEIDNGIMTYTCVNCSDTKEVVIPVLTHTHTASEAVKENEIAPTCTKAGSYDLVVYCSLGDNYEFSRETVPVSATGHSFTNYVSNCDATCTSDGTKTAKCDYCDATDTIVDEGTKLEHDYISIITNSTCIERGYTTHICKFCGDSYISDYTEISEHTIVFDDAVAATCTQTGATAGAHCSVCGKVFIAQDAVDALGHTWNEGTVTKNSTYTETGIKNTNARFAEK